METLIVTGGSLDENLTLNCLQNHDFDRIIAVDHGLDFLDAHQILPTEIVGDFDSMAPGLFEKYNQIPGITISRFQPEKDDTDTELAVKQSIACGSTHVTMLGATGTRLDHVLGNLSLLAQFLEAGIEAEILDPNNRITMIDQEKELDKAKQYGHYISLIPFGGTVTGITLTGFKYPLLKYTLYPEVTRCISNEIKDQVAKISFDTGRLIVIESKDK